MKEFDIKNCNNWYRIYREAQTGNKPYNIFAQPGGGQEEFLGQVLAVSALQARNNALRGFGVDKDLMDKCRSRREMGIEIVALLDDKEWKRMQQQQVEINRREEDNVQKMWWND